MTASYNNIPSDNSAIDSTIRVMDRYYSQPFELHAGTFNLMKGFFESRNFDKTSAEQLSVTIMKQAKLDGYNPLFVLDSLRDLDEVALNSTISEIINYNRFKTSFLGYSTGFTSFAPVSRNIVA